MIIINNSGGKKVTKRLDMSGDGFQGMIGD